jgi:carboxypeptidase Taq
MSLEKTVSDFNAYLNKIMALSVAIGSLHWDNAAGISKGGLRTRGRAIAMLSEEVFKMRVGPEMKAFLDALDEQAESLDKITKAKHRIMRRIYYENENVPSELVREYSEFRVQSEEIWKQAKNADDFAVFAPYLKRGIAYAARFAELRFPEIVKESGIYNAKLYGYEPGLTTDVLDEFFGKLRTRIVPLLKRVTESKKVIDRSFADNPISVENQKKIAEILSNIVGYDLERGNISETEHPCCMGLSKYDIRIFTHYYENDFLSSVFAVLHECGHAIYEQGSADEIAETILDSGASMSIHESQSRFYENIIGRSEEFWRFALPKVKDLMGEGCKDVTPRMMYEAVNLAKPGLIRIEADELTYALHVMVRYELEKELFAAVQAGGAESVDVMSLPALWNKKYEEYLGLTPPDNKTGILQDVHWSAGLFAYFPSYALGNAYGAHMLHYMKKEIDVYAEIERGNIAVLTEWLNRHIHTHGSVYEPLDLFRNIAGEDMNADYLVEYLEGKYTELYEL